MPREIGSRRAGKHAKGAEAAGIELANPDAVAVTPTSLVMVGDMREFADVFERAKATV